MADERLRTKSQLKHLFTNLKNKGISEDMIGILIDVLWRDRVNQRTSGFDYAGSYDSQISFDAATRIFTIKPFDPLVTGFVPRYGIFSWVNLAVYHRIYDTLSIQIPNEEGLFCIYFDKEPDPGRNQVLTVVKNPTTAQLQGLYVSKIIISFIYWDAENGELIHFGDDRHGSEWNPQIHWYLHKAFAARRQSGLEFVNMIVDGDGSLDAHAQFKISTGIILHDDFELSIPASTTSIPILYSLGTLPRFLSNPGYGIAKGANRIYFNSGQSSLAECASGNYCLYHIFSTNEILTTSRKTISVMGINQYSTLADAYTNVNFELDTVFTYMPQQGACYIASIIVKTDDTFTNSIKARIVSIVGKETHPPVSIAPGSIDVLSINEKQQLSFNTAGLGGGGGGGLAEIAFEFCVEAGLSTTHDIDVYCSAPYTIAKAILESDGTLNNVKIKIAGGDVTGLDAMTISAIAVFTATANNAAIEANRVTIVTSGTDSGTPTVLKGKIVFA